LTKYNVVVEGKQYRIDLAKTENQEHFAVKIDDKPYKLELSSKFEYDKPIEVRLDSKTFTIQVTKNQKQAPLQMRIQDIPITAEVKTQQLNSFPQITTMSTAPPMNTAVVKTQTEKATNQGAIIAPMAGKIVAIKVKKGDQVKAGAVVCILEAMKMENEIVAQKDGYVKEILVSTGAGVNKGDQLFIIEPSKN